MYVSKIFQYKNLKNYQVSYKYVTIIPACLVFLVILYLFSGFLDPSSESEDIAAGTVVELPYWLAQSLCSRRCNIVTVEIPKIYKEAYRSVHDSEHQVYSNATGCPPSHRCQSSRD
jgi:hypothetical protein